LIETKCLKLRRKLARKVSRMNGNAVIGYQQQIDDEGQKSERIVIRGYGTAIIMDHNANNDDNQPVFLMNEPPF
jgi:hypothetical protein